MNINMLRDADNDAGFYAAACAADPTLAWPGAVLYASSDEGASYHQMATIPAQATMGTALTALGDFHGGNIPDEINTVQVQLAHGSLSSTTFAGMLAGINTCVIGQEILHFRDAQLVSGSTYTLRGLLRGRRGSEYAMGSHQANERFVFVNAALARVAATNEHLGMTKLYKPVPVGGALANAEAKEWTNEGKGLMPYAPVYFRGWRDSDGHIHLGWTRRTRIDGGWRNLVDVPIGEASEAYVVRVFSNDTYASEVRTIESTNPFAVYHAEQQTSDFGSPQSTVYFDVRQVSAVIGPGYAARGVV